MRKIELYVDMLFAQACDSQRAIATGELGELCGCYGNARRVFALQRLGIPIYSYTQNAVREFRVGKTKKNTRRRM